MTGAGENMPDEYSNAQHPDHLLNSEVTFEATDIRVASIVRLGIALLITLFVSLFIVWATFRTMELHQFAEQPILSPLRVGMAPVLPPEPRLQGEPGSPMLGPQELRSVLSQARTQLDSSGWVNQSAGITHIPIQQAMDMIVQHGLPDVHPPPAAKVVALATAAAARTAGAKRVQPGSERSTPKNSMPRNPARKGAGQ
jgi:hypothetical protein